MSDQQPSEARNLDRYANGALEWSRVVKALSGPPTEESTVWEIEIKRALGKLDAPPGLADAIEQSALGSLPITLRDAEAAAGLPAHHRGPFDRMLVAQAQRIDAVVVTRDQVFARYGVEALPA